ncbi:hypothetical protein ACIRQP_31915 [Streptomyces sp. NPDC102274]|uniref:hypothetical protein n=1 Tax=Streptomyces sp. NPDC102274 TaxID=3366151 RepID=UPI0037F7A61E
MSTPASTPASYFEDMYRDRPDPWCLAAAGRVPESTSMSPQTAALLTAARR